MPAETNAEAESNDILFECPHCGKSLAIAEQGQGMMIVCPDCRTSIQVPGIATPSDARVAEEEHEMLVGSSGNVNERIGKELELIQAALDRIVDLLQEQR